MLETLLGLIAAQGTISSADLARSLDVTDALLDDMLNALTRKGYLRVIAQGGAAACDRCPMRKACLYRRQARIWVLSPKGESLLNLRWKDKLN